MFGVDSLFFYFYFYITSPDSIVEISYISKASDKYAR